MVGVTLLVVGVVVVVVRLVVSTARGALRSGDFGGTSSSGELDSSSLEETNGAVPLMDEIVLSTAGGGGVAVASANSLVTIILYAAQMHSHTKRYWLCKRRTP